MGRMLGKKLGRMLEKMFGRTLGRTLGRKLDYGPETEPLLQYTGHDTGGASCSASAAAAISIRSRKFPGSYRNSRMSGQKASNVRPQTEPPFHHP